jgi:hypothetical protein
MKRYGKISFDRHTTALARRGEFKRRKPMDDIVEWKKGEVNDARFTPKQNSMLERITEGFAGRIRVAFPRRARGGARSEMDKIVEEGEVKSGDK